MKPIETHYNGYRFRSRLEARWAVFFDAAGISYRYEPDGFETSSGDRWLPDFEIDLGGKWLVEVKGEAAHLNVNLLGQVCQEDDVRKGVIILGDVPNLRDNRRPLHGVIVDSLYLPGRKTGHALLWAAFMEEGVAVMFPDDTPPRSAFDLVQGSIMPPDQRPPRSLSGAYHKARAARFEFGETPKAARS